MPQLSWHDVLLIFSFVAAIAGLALLLSDSNPADEVEAADHMLLMMSFAYWLVFCLATGAQHLIQPEWESIVLGVKFTGVIAYLLTATCILSLPLHRVSARQPE